MANLHGTRAHSKFSASGMDRWKACPGSIHLSEGLPDKPSSYAEEGTKAHELLEKFILNPKYIPESDYPPEMVWHVKDSANFILKLHKKTLHSELLAESRVYLTFIHPEAFGTLDAAIVEHFGYLHILDFKFGAGHIVSPKENYQLLFYALAVAHQYEFNFSMVRLWVIQPRARGYDGPVFWELSIQELKNYIPVFEKAVKRVEVETKTYVEGAHCHWCRAKGICPLKNDKKIEKAQALFAQSPFPDCNAAKKDLHFFNSKTRK